MLTWTFPALLACAASFICTPAGSTFQLQWFGEERSSKEDAKFNHQPSPVAFPCDTNSSAPPATSVHQLRPQDVAIIGAVGDSISAGVGATALNIIDVFNEDRGVSFVTGGEGSWWSTSSLANILKEFNPGLVGSSYGSTRAFVPFEQQSGKAEIGFNLALSRSLAQDVPAMVKQLVRRIRSQVPGWRRLWKLVTILIGHNDVCNHTCPRTFLRDLGVDKSTDVSAKAYKRHIREGVKILYRSLPRTMVILIPIGDLTQVLGQFPLPAECQAAHWFVCPCWATHQGKILVRQLIEGYKASLHQIAADVKFARKDFTVEVAPTTAGRLPMSGGRVKPGLLSPDCLHLSRRANSIFGRNLWNNLMQPWSHKQVDYREDTQSILCPTKEHPFLSTQINS